MAAKVNGSEHCVCALFSQQPATHFRTVSGPHPSLRSVVRQHAETCRIAWSQKGERVTHGAGGTSTGGQLRHGALLAHQTAAGDLCRQQCLGLHSRTRGNLILEVQCLEPFCCPTNFELLLFVLPQWLLQSQAAVKLLACTFWFDLVGHLIFPLVVLSCLF